MLDNLPKELHKFERWLHYRLHLSLSDVYPCDTKGYWKVKKGCGGGEKCVHAFRGVLGPCDGTVELTVSYAHYDARDEFTGRLMSPYIAWYQHRQMLDIK